MAEMLVEVLTDTTNAPVLRMPGRRYPGILIQGDGLKVLCDLVEDLGALVESRGEAADTLSELDDLLQGYRKSYESVLVDTGWDLPYAKSNPTQVP